MPSDKPQPGANPFGDAMTMAMTQARTAAEEFARMFATMRLPSMPDAESLMVAHKRNLEAVAEANRVAIEGAQAVARRQMEIMQQTMGELTETMRAIGSGGAPQARATRQAELLKQAYERAVAHTRELAELIQRSNAEAMGALNRRFNEAMDEVKALMHQAAAKTE